MRKSSRRAKKQRFSSTGFLQLVGACRKVALDRTQLLAGVRHDGDAMIVLDHSAHGRPETKLGFGLGQQQSQAEGTGFVYDTSGHIVTNEHVVDGAVSISVKFWDGRTYKATLVGSDSTTVVGPALSTDSV